MKTGTYDVFEILHAGQYYFSKCILSEILWDSMIFCSLYNYR